MRYLEFLAIIMAFTIFTIACGEKEESKIVEEISMESEVSGHIVLELDEFSKAKNSITSFSYIDNYYYFYNDFNQSLYFYSLDQEINTPKKIVKVPLDESINFKSVSEVFVHSMDSIFIYNGYGSEGDMSDLFIINPDSEVLDMFDLLNVQNKDPHKFSKTYAVNGQTMYYHNGKIILPVAINRYTEESKYKPLYIYDLAERIGEYYGEYPESFEMSKFGNETYKLYASVIPELEKVYLSFPYESNLYSFDLSDNSWEEIPFETDLVVQPSALEGGDEKDKLQYDLINSWYVGLYYDKASKSLLRLAHIGGNINKSDIPEANSGIPIPGMDNYQTFVIDPETGEYSVIPDINLYNARLFHPQYGPYQISKTNEELGFDPEDHLVFTPMMRD
tara:strand:- start:1085 stop:2257 length:1173 start_codon:yes stop_codon:yes gene_type:complete